MKYQNGGVLIKWMEGNNKKRRFVGEQINASVSKKKQKLISYVTQDELNKYIENSQANKYEMLNNLCCINNESNNWYINLDFINYFLYGFICNIDINNLLTLETTNNIYTIYPYTNILDTLKEILNIEQSLYYTLMIGNDNKTNTNFNAVCNNTTIIDPTSKKISAAKSGANLIFYKKECFTYMGKPLIIKYYDIMDKNIKSYLSLDIYIINDNETGYGFNQISTTRTYKISNYYGKFVQNKIKMIFSEDNQMFEKDGFLICQNHHSINEIIMNEIIAHHINNNDKYDKCKENILNFHTSLLCQYQTVNDLDVQLNRNLNMQLGLLMEMATGDLFNFIKDIEELIQKQKIDNTDTFKINLEQLEKILKDSKYVQTHKHTIENIEKIKNFKIKNNDSIEKNLLNFFDKIILDYCTVLHNLKQDLNFMHADIKTTNIFYKIVKINKTDLTKNLINRPIEPKLDLDNFYLLDFDNQLLKLENFVELIQTYVTNKIEYINIVTNLVLNKGEYSDKNYTYKFYILLADLDKSTLIYNNIRFNSSPSVKIASMFASMSNYINSYGDNSFDILSASHVVGFNVEYISYYARNSPIPIYNSYDYYMLFFSLLKTSSIFSIALLQTLNIKSFIKKILLKMYPNYANKYDNLVNNLIQVFEPPKDRIAHGTSDILKDLINKSKNFDLKYIHNFNIDDLLKNINLSKKNEKLANKLYLSPIGLELDTKIILTEPQIYIRGTGIENEYLGFLNKIKGYILNTSDLNYIQAKNCSSCQRFMIYNNSRFESNTGKTLDEYYYYFKTNLFSKFFYRRGNYIYYNYLKMPIQQAKLYMIENNFVNPNDYKLPDINSLYIKYLKNNSLEITTNFFKSINVYWIINKFAIINDNNKYNIINNGQGFVDTEMLYNMLIIYFNTKKKYDNVSNIDKNCGNIIYYYYSKINNTKLNMSIQLYNNYKLLFNDYITKLNIKQSYIWSYSDDYIYNFLNLTKNKIDINIQNKFGINNHNLYKIIRLNKNVNESYDTDIRYIALQNFQKSNNIKLLFYCNILLLHINQIFINYEKIITNDKKEIIKNIKNIYTLYTNIIQQQLEKQSQQLEEQSQQFVIINKEQLEEQQRQQLDEQQKQQLDEQQRQQLDEQQKQQLDEQQKQQLDEQQKQQLEEHQRQQLDEQQIKIIEEKINNIIEIETKLILYTNFTMDNATDEQIIEQLKKIINMYYFINIKMILLKSNEKILNDFFNIIKDDEYVYLYDDNDDENIWLEEINKDDTIMNCIKLLLIRTGVETGRFDKLQKGGSNYAYKYLKYKKKYLELKN